MVGYYLSIFGLFLDIIGVVLIFYYGVYSSIQLEFLSEVSKTQGTRIVINKPDKDDIEPFLTKYTLHKKRSKIGLILLVLGFVFQLIGILAQIPNIDWSCGCGY